MSRKKIVDSFDIFDTCLVRTCGTPNSFFKLLSQYVFNDDVSDMTKQQFVMARYEAEKKAFSENKNYNIYDIYRHFSFSNQLEKTAKELIDIEIGLEKQVLVPVHNIIQLIEEKRAKGHLIIFISDMYLPTPIMEEIMSKYGFLKEEDKVYVSCDNKANKYDGSLYRLIQDREKILYSNWHHYGDNKVSDYKIPQKIGIKCKLVKHNYSIYQSQWISPLEDPFSVNHINAITAGLSRAISLTTNTHLRNALLSDIIAPLYCSFIYQVYINAQKNKIDQLFFCSRDTYQLFQIAKKYNHLFPEIKIKYLFISRKALTDTDEKVLINYFEQEGLANKKLKSAIVDSTTSGNTKYLINNILKKNGYNPISINVIAYYYMNDKFLHLTEEDYIGICFNGFEKYSIMLIENIFSTNTSKRVIGYHYNGRKILPSFDTVTNEDTCIQPNFKALQNKHSSFLDRYSSLFILNKLHPFSKHIITNISFPTLLSFIHFPLKEYSASLLNCVFYVNEKEYIALLKKESFYHLIKTKGKDTYFERATMIYNLPNFFTKYLQRRIKNK